MGLDFLAALRERNRIKSKWRNSSFQKEKWKRREKVQLEIELNVAQKLEVLRRHPRADLCVFGSTLAQHGELWNRGPELCSVAPQPTPACDGDQSTQASFSEALNNFWTVWFGSFQIQAASTGFCWWFWVGRALNKQPTTTPCCCCSDIPAPDTQSLQFPSPLSTPENADFHLYLFLHL